MKFKKKAMRNLPPKLNQSFIPMMHQQYHEWNFHPKTYLDKQIEMQDGKQTGS